MLCKGKENSCRFKGNVGKDAHVSETKDKRSVISFSLATTQSFRDEDPALWLKCVYFADTTNRYGQVMKDILSAVKSGDYVEVVGYVRQNEYNRNDGTKGFEVELVIEQFSNLVRKADKPAGKAPAGTEPLSTLF